MAYETYSFKRGPSGVVFDDRDRDQASQRNQSNQIMAQSAMQDKSINANRQAQSDALAAQKYAVDAGLLQSGTFDQRSAAEMAAIAARQAPDMARLDEDKRRYDATSWKNDLERSRAEREDAFRVKMLDRFSGGQSPDGGIGDMADQELLMSLIALGGDPGAILNYKAQRGQVEDAKAEREFARRAEAMKFMNPQAQARAAAGMFGGEAGDYQSGPSVDLLKQSIKSRAGEFSDRDTTSWLKPAMTGSTLAGLMVPGAGLLGGLFGAYEGATAPEPEDGSDQRILDLVESLTQAYLMDPQVGGDEVLAREMALDTLRESLESGSQGSDALTDWDADKTRALWERAKAR